MFTETEIKTMNAWLFHTMVKKSKIFKFVVIGYENDDKGCCTITKKFDGYVVTHYKNKTAKEIANTPTLPVADKEFLVKSSNNLALLCLLLRHFDKEGLTNNLEFPTDWVA